MLHVSHASETGHMMGIRDFARMKKSTIFINIAKGKVIDECALIQALINKYIGPLVLMFFKREPLPHYSQLLEMDNFTLTPRI
jgi:D-3-phosphoglycerate dehydrogenase